MGRLTKGVFVALALACSSAMAQDAKAMDSVAAVKVCKGKVNDDCVVRFFKDTKEASVIRGRSVYQAYCVLCHGAEGKGDGRAAKLHTPRPFNLTMSAAPRDYISQVIVKGGEAIGRGKGMPPWGEQLTQEQLNDTLNYLFSIRKQ